MFDGNDKYLTRAKLCDMDIPGKSIYDNYLQIFIELPKFVADDRSLNDERDELLYILKNLRQMDALPEWVEGSHEEIRMICDSALFGLLSETEKEECIMREDEQIRWEKAVEHSLKKGREEGREEGGEEGGADKQREIAARMKAAGMAYEQICLFTGISLKEAESQ